MWQTGTESFVILPVFQYYKLTWLIIIIIIIVFVDVVVDDVDDHDNDDDDDDDVMQSYDIGI